MWAAIKHLYLVDNISIYYLKGGISELLVSSVSYHANGVIHKIVEITNLRLVQHLLQYKATHAAKINRCRISVCPNNQNQDSGF